MISWHTFKQLKPDWVEAAERLHLQPGSNHDGIGMLATVARDGRPRMAPVCPILANEDLWLCVSNYTVKSFDLQNDGRYVLHAFLGTDDEEFQISGSVNIVRGSDHKSSIQSAITFQYDPDDMICELTLNRAIWAYWVNPGQPGTRVVKQRWCL